MAPWAHKVMIELRDYANEGGKLVVDGRNVHQTFTATARASQRHRPVHLDAGQAVRLLLPAEQRGRRRPARHGLAALARISNDTWQNYLGVVGRQSGIGVTLPNTANSANPDIAGAPVAPRPAASSPAWRRSPSNQAQAASRTRPPTARAADGPLPLRLRTVARPNEPLRAERVEADYATPVSYTTTGGAVISTRDTGDVRLRSRAARPTATRNEVVKRTMAYLLPTTADTTPPTIVGFKYPAEQLDRHPA